MLLGGGKSKGSSKGNTTTSSGIGSVNSDGGSGLNVATTQDDAAIKIQCLFRGYCYQQLIPHKLAANECRNEDDTNFIVMFKAKRTQDKTIPRFLSRHITRSGRRYHKAVHKMQPSVVVIPRAIPCSKESHLNEGRSIPPYTY